MVSVENTSAIMHTLLHLNMVDANEVIKMWSAISVAALHRDLMRLRNV